MPWDLKKFLDLKISIKGKKIFDAENNLSPRFRECALQPVAVNHKCSLRNCSPQLFPISQSIGRRFDNFANVEENIRSKCQMPGNWKQERIKCMSAQFCFSALPIIWVKSGPKHTKNAKQMLSFSSPS